MIRAGQHRRSIRLRGYDYTQAGAYFITICSCDRLCVFAEIVAGVIDLTQIEGIVTARWEAIPEHFATAELDAFVVMPNHLHGIVVLGARVAGSEDAAAQGTACRAFLVNRFGPLPPERIATLWQSNCHEHVVRNERSLDHLRAYIAANPARWVEDSLHPDHPGAPIIRSGANCGSKTSRQSGG
jgi:putative transposase